MQNQLTPEAFKAKIVAKHPNGVASDGMKYADMDATDLTKRIVQKYPSAVTEDGHKYSDYLPKEAPVAPAPEAEKGIFGKLGDRAKDFGNAVYDSYKGNITAPEAGLREAGAVGGAVSDIGGAVLGLIPGVKQAEKLIGEGVSKVAQTAPGQAVLGGVQNFTQEHPRLAKNLGAAGNIIGGATVLTGAGSVKKVVGTGIKNALGRSGVESIVSDIAPNLTAKTAAKGIIKSGTTKSAITGTIAPAIEKGATETADLIKKVIPGFQKLSTFSDKVNATRKAVTDLAESLKNDVVKSGQDRIYSFKELQSTLKGIEKPLMVSSDTTLNNAYDRVLTKAMEIARKNGGKVSDLFSARKEFDAFIARQFPNLYASDTLTPIRTAVKDIRNGMNGFIDKNLPSNLGFRERLLEQTKLLDAVENMAPKAVKELGTNRLGRFAEKHPIATGLLKKAAGTAVGGAGLGTGYGIYKGIMER